MHMTLTQLPIPGPGIVLKAPKETNHEKKRRG